mmetsp:Transcript_6852/g.12214  ORF Transcript_6852/g.12214 Transcript_6852/m.12214 type:complete len:94 (+) Transcript_6852:872-1153(+)
MDWCVCAALAHISSTFDVNGMGKSGDNLERKGDTTTVLLWSHICNVFGTWATQKVAVYRAKKTRWMKTKNETKSISVVKFSLSACQMDGCAYA